jgi:hypothetical protein
MIPLIVLRKKNVVKRRTGCCAKRGQRQNALAQDVHPGSPLLLAISGFGEVWKKSNICNQWLHISQAESAKEDQPSTEVTSKFLRETI